jgi:hypothetical protein
LTTEKEQLKASAGDRPRTCARTVTEVNALKTDNKFRFCVSRFRGFRSSGTGSPRSKLRMPSGSRREISMESLILAQDERWRRA